MIKLKKVFEILGVKPNEKFKIKGEFKLYSFDENLNLYFYDDFDNYHLTLTNTFLELLKGNYEIIKLSKKKKLRNITPEEWDEWIKNNCKCPKCEKCIFGYASCTKSNVSFSWVHNKDLYSDKFLDQEIEVE